jgi:hypothetical protein
MRSKLIPLRLNELLDRPLILSFNSTLAFVLLVTCDSAILFSRSVSNARHHPPAAAFDDESRAIAGRVHAVVMRRRIMQESSPIYLDTD